MLTILFYPKGISAETKVSAEVFGIDIVHAVEFSKIGCVCDFSFESSAEQLSKSTDYAPPVNPWFPSDYAVKRASADLNLRRKNHPPQGVIEGTKNVVLELRI